MKYIPIILSPFECPSCKTVEYFDISTFKLSGCDINFSCGYSLPLDSFQQSGFSDLQHKITDLMSEALVDVFNNKPAEHAGPNTSTLPIRALADLIKQNQKPGMVVAEVGVFDGSTTLDYIDIISRNNGILYAIDWFKGGYPYGISREESAGNIHGYRPDEVDELCRRFQDNLKDYLGIIKLLAGTSEEKIAEIPDNSLDICFIDADHTYTHVHQDISLALPKVKTGGIICGHDFENINLANTFSTEQLAVDCAKLTIEQQRVRSNTSNWPREYVHAGSIQAVFDHFGYDVEHREDPLGHNVPLWFKRKI